MSPIIKTLFPVKTRTFKLKRWVKIGLRTLHLIGVAGAAGGLIHDQPLDVLFPFLVMMNVSGILFILLEIWSNGIWLIQLRGIVISLKIGIIILLPYFPQRTLFFLIGIIIVSSIISHAPGDVRYYSPWHGKRLDTLYS